MAYEFQIVTQRIGSGVFKQPPSVQLTVFCCIGVGATF
jgi:hypothetical protein